MKDTPKRSTERVHPRAGTNITMDEAIEKSVKILENLILPLFMMVFTTMMIVYIPDFFRRFGIVFLVSFLSFLLIYAYKKSKGVDNTDLKQKSLEIFIKTLINTSAISVYILFFMFGNKPLFVHDAIEKTLLVHLDILGMTIGLWILIWIMSYLLSKNLSK